ncbi:hypothetical protein MGG_16940 [Pyricularia oryzae 70-15]|uniref:Uncharacterized protein n=1 Tax=Pyricularia oryzae (strain 70-15 / ATCC MYA-4617 / FGSC 8958) TaxID=242507 RepID=G4N1H3_PYRO7|nr:uncharacterized protein MGG_16940 [Pyricularia oryzae 70-15]XP_003719508.1 uncharacterized protein MGG_17636 [Pyricularia oryzae 70-15]EHA47141.1 hypothetical protein MGG_17636 [Pyricularia oryzae 70-15]EHA53240.1 hypothetical protein MGG_16940 [Pyricularia oryzae 70-15]
MPVSYVKGGRNLINYNMSIAQLTSYLPVPALQHAALDSASIAVRILLPPPPPRLPVARITRLAIDNNHPPVPSSPHLLGTSSPWLQTTDSSAVWTQAPLDEEPSTAVRRILRAPEGTGSRQ